MFWNLSGGWVAFVFLDASRNSSLVFTAYLTRSTHVFYERRSRLKYFSIKPSEYYSSESVCYLVVIPITIALSSGTASGSITLLWIKTRPQDRHHISQILQLLAASWHTHGVWRKLNRWIIIWIAFVSALSRNCSTRSDIGNKKNVDNLISVNLDPFGTRHQIAGSFKFWKKKNYIVTQENVPTLEKKKKKTLGGFLKRNVALQYNKKQCHRCQGHKINLGNPCCKA